MYAIVYGLLEELPQIIPVPASEPPHLENRSPLSLVPPRITTAPYWPTQGYLNPTPDRLSGFWNQPPDLFKHPPALFTPEPLYPPFDATTPTPSALAYWSQPPDLLRHPPELWAREQWNPALYNQPPSTWWWTEPLDLEKHPPELFANQTFFAPLPTFPGLTPVALGFWVEPLDLESHPAHLDTNLPQMTFASQQVLATPVALGFWAEPPDLQWHALHLDTNQAQDPWLMGRTGVPTPKVFWWTEPPDLLRLLGTPDTNQSRLVSQQFSTPSPLAFWVEPPDLIRHPAQLDTNQPRLVSQQFAVPGIYWWSQPPDILRHAAHLDTNQPEFIFAGLSPFATPVAMGFWIQAPDLLRHPPELWIDEPRVPPEPSFPNQTPGPLGWWIQQTPLPWSARHLDTQQSARTWEGGETPFEPATWWWTQPPDLLSHAKHLDTNEPVVSFRDQDTPRSLAFFRQAPDTPRRAPELAPAAPPVSPLPSTATGTAFGFWMQPQFQPPRAPDLWTFQTYESRGAALSSSPLILPPAAFLARVAPHIGGVILLPGRDFPITPKQLAFFFHPEMHKHPAELFTWQTYVGPNRIFDTPNVATYFGQPRDLLRIPPGDITQPWTHIVGWRYPFIGSAFIVTRSKLRMVPATRRAYSAPASARLRIITGTQNRQKLPDLQPPIIAGVEKEYVIFDFGRMLNAGASVFSIVAVNCLTVSGPDVAPMTRILSTPIMVGTGVTALFGNMIAGNLYMLECLVMTSDGQELVLEARWSCKSAT